MVDGFTFQLQQLQVFFPHEPERLITGKVLDTAFCSLPNIYTEAATRRACLRVTATPVWQEGLLKTLHIHGAELMDDPPKS